jgi:deoxyribonuclease V
MDIDRGIVDCDLPAELQRLLQQVPRGRVTTYGRLAAALGDRTAARWVGEYLVDHPHDERCPCHRVVRETGDAGLYIAGDSDAKLSRLRKEGIRITAGRVDLDDPFEAFASSAPLARLHAFQLDLPTRLQLTPLGEGIRHVAGIDAAYRDGATAVGAIVVVDAESLETVWSTTVLSAVRFPYISGYLAFRELPVMLRAWDAARKDGPPIDAVLIDGNGRLHPRRAGIACCFGLLVDVPVIGIGKTLLCGRVDLAGMRSDEFRPVEHDGEQIGLAVRCGERSRPVYVSPGNRCDLASAARLVKRLMNRRRLPEPLQRADRLSKRSAC